jgi:hypothetical protein
MKFVGALILVFIGSMLRSQTVQISVVAGAGASSWKSRQVLVAQSNTSFAYGLGFKYTYPQQSRLSIHGEFLTQRLTFTRSMFVRDPGGFTGPVLGKERFDCISIPIYAGWSFFKGSFKLFVKAGAYFSLIYHHDIGFRNFTFQGSTFERITLNDHSPEDLGCLLATGFQSPLGRRMTFTLEMRENFGVANQSPSTILEPSYFNSYLLMCGFGYKFFKRKNEIQ